MGKSTISMAIFNSFLYVYQRVWDDHPDGRMAHMFCRCTMLFLFWHGATEDHPWMGKPWQAMLRWATMSHGKELRFFFVSKIHHDRNNNSIIRMLQDMHSFTICLLLVDSLVSLVSSIHLLMRIFVGLLLHWFHSMSCHSIHQSFTASLMHLGRTTPSMRCVFKQLSL